VLVDALRSNRGPLVGRHLELEQLRAVLSACRTDGRGRAFYVRGEAGIGLMSDIHLPRQRSTRWPERIPFDENQLGQQPRIQVPT
jgi:hypothetical protein